ncbi:MAG: hypothetical protein QM751_08480 [Paludibacteraceae bacterium]
MKRTEAFISIFKAPEAADLLNEISYRFKENLPEKKKNDFLFLVTSPLMYQRDATRTE